MMRPRFTIRARMQIRSITCGVDASWPLAPSTIAAASEFFEHAKRAFDAEQVAVQTTRLATQPAHRFLAPAQLPEFAGALQAACSDHAIAYASAGGIVLSHDPSDGSITGLG